ncbi:MAG: hypothetical protein J6A89_01360 [Clostridia bacterium]|nr:hypothetical protein [Clostridia bacterium]
MDKEKEKKQEQNVEQINTKSENVPTKKKRTGLLIGIIGGSVALLLIAIILIYFLIFAKKTIDLSECFKVEYNGYNGYATANVSLDQDKLKDKIKDSSVAKNFVKKAELEVDNYTGLSNGDEIKVKVSISNSFLESNKLKLKETKIKIPVTELEDFENLDLSKYVKLKYTGFNKHATAEVEIDQSLEDVIRKDAYKNFIKQAKFTVTNNGSLENDKDAEITVNISNSWLTQNGITLTSNTFKVKVSGLEEGSEIDVFTGMKVAISGMSPNLSISITNESTDEFIKTVKFTASKTSGISNGETIKIEATNWDKNMANEKKYVLKSTTTEYKIENQAAYVSKTSEITDAIKTQIKTSFIEKAKSKAAETRWYSGEGDNQDAKHQIRNNTDYKYVTTENYDQDLQLENSELVSLYLLTKKDNSSSGATNQVIGIVKMSYKSTSSGATYNWYITVKASNFSTKTDGTISDNAVYQVSTESGKDQESAYQEWINGEKDSYNVENIAL